MGGGVTPVPAEQSDSVRRRRTARRRVSWPRLRLQQQDGVDGSSVSVTAIRTATSGATGCTDCVPKHRCMGREGIR